MGPGESARAEIGFPPITPPGRPPNASPAIIEASHVFTLVEPFCDMGDFPESAGSFGVRGGGAVAFVPIKSPKILQARQLNMAIRKAKIDGTRQPVTRL